MRRIFRVIRKKRNLRRLRAVCCMFLMFFEIFSHAQNESQIFAAERSSLPEMKISLSDKSDAVQTQTLIAVADDESSGSHQPSCQDEISHHQGLISGFTYSFNAAFSTSERIASRRAGFVYNSLPPPYLPPKFS